MAYKLVSLVGLRRLTIYIPVCSRLLTVAQLSTHRDAPSLPYYGKVRTAFLCPTKNMIIDFVGFLKQTLFFFTILVLYWTTVGIRV